MVSLDRRGEPPQLHGPCAFWTRKIDGKTVTRMLSEEEVADHQPLFDNARKLRELMSELHELSLQLVERAPPRTLRKPVSRGASKLRTSSCLHSCETWAHGLSSRAVSHLRRRVTTVPRLSAFYGIVVYVHPGDHSPPHFTLSTAIVRR